MGAKLIIANRGEIACRVIAAARLLNIPTVAIYSEADAEALHTRLADESYCIGPAPAPQSYLRQDVILEVAKKAGATLLHPGYGFLAENSGFARQCAAADLTFVGPSPDVIEAMGDKERARGLAQRAGVPIARGSGKLGEDKEANLAAGRDVGYPLLVKASAGGGGIGMRLVGGEGDLSKAIAETRSLAERAFGDGAVFLEHFVRRARHIEVQVFGFGDGRATHLYDRDCSVQRRHQKIIEEAVSPALDLAKRAEICAVAQRLAEECRYGGAGTVEFLFDDESGEFFFLEMNTRIQVEHPVTEQVTGVDLVAAQIRLALGEDVSRELSAAPPPIEGHSIEARIYSERPHKKFLPSPGPLNTFEMPSGEGIRVDTGYTRGQTVTPYYDPMLAKLIVHGADRSQAIARLDEALRNTVIEGVETNIGFLRNILAHKDFQAGQAHTGWLEQVLPELV